MTGRMKVIDSMDPGELEADAGVAVRTFFEHTLYLAWLAADSSADRIRAWRKSDLKFRLAADDDARAHQV
jgi:hypothetical protein